MEQAMQGLNEFIIIKGGASILDEGASTPSYVEWTANDTQILIDLYKDYRPKVGTCRMKNMKQMWKAVSTGMNEKHNLHYNEAHRENRWKVLERNYKKHVDD